MTIQECYAAMGSDYEEVLGRLRSPRIIQKFILKFLDDGSYRQLEESLAAENYPEAFRAAHTIKGVCQNLNLSRLGASSAALADALRSGQWNDAAAPLVAQVREDYQIAAAAIRAFREANPG